MAKKSSSSDQASWKRILRKSLRYSLYVLGLFVFTSFCYTLYLRWFPPFMTPLMLVRATETPDDPEEGRTHIRANWRSWDGMADNVKLAAMAGEDPKFPHHWGFDFEAIQDAIKTNIEGKRLVGGSTISQQVAKNVFLWQGRSFLRKGLEAYFTVLIEVLWSKRRILEVYLNIAETGDGLFGVQAAASYYYHKDALELNAAEAASIVAIFPFPRKFTPLSKHREVQSNIRHIRRNMNFLGRRTVKEIE